MAGNRNAPYTRDSVQTTPWPAVTIDQMTTVLRDAEKYTAVERNEFIHALILARKAVGDAKIAVACAGRQCGDKAWVSARLTEILASLEVIGKQFPLTVIGQGTGRRRQVVQPFGGN